MSGYPVWKKREVQKKWNHLLTVFLVTVLLFAIVNGVLKTVSTKKAMDASAWDGKSSYVIALNTTPPSLFVYQNDPERLSFFIVSPDNNYFTGNPSLPFRKIADVMLTKDGKKFANASSAVYGVLVKNYAIFKDSPAINQEKAEELFKKYASIFTPFAILGGKVNAQLENTNITRYDMFRLWWKLKSLSVKNVKFVDFSQRTEEIVAREDETVQGYDIEFLHKEVSAFVENPEIAKDHSTVEIQNASGNPYVSILSSRMISSFGFTVVSVSNEPDYIDGCQVVVKEKSYASGYLSGIFDCDILQDGKNEKSAIIVRLGRNFANEYLH